MVACVITPLEARGNKDRCGCATPEPESTESHLKVEHRVPFSFPLPIAFYRCSVLEPHARFFCFETETADPGVCCCSHSAIAHCFHVSFGCALNPLAKSSYN